MGTRLVPIGVMCVLALAALACGLGGVDTVQQTANAMSTELAQASPAGVTQRSPVTQSVGSTPGPILQAAQAQATAAIAAITQTAQVRDLNDAQQAADATAAAEPVTRELANLGVDSSRGGLGWVHPPVTLSVEGYLVYDFVNYYLQEVIPSDFVLSTEFTWDTTTGVAGCGFVMRSNGDQEALDQYMVIATRAGNGTAFFVVQTDTSFGREYTLEGIGLDANNGAANTLTIVAQGSQFDIYTNGNLAGAVTDDTYRTGYVAVVALSESGTTTCDFNNTWLWVLDE